MTALYIRSSAEKGRGVFAGQALKSGALVEQCPVILMPMSERQYLDKTTLHDYYFAWDSTHCSFPLGFGGLYNHSFKPNAVYRVNLSERTLDFVAIKDIAGDTEITVNYNGHPKDRTPLWKMKSGGIWKN